MPDATGEAHLDQLGETRVHRDQIDAERLGCERGGGGDFRVEQIGRHRAGGDHAETAGIRDRGDQVAL
jgi:hypothetical protein